ncbi:MAG TPA: FkbM family methyltransferase [Gemmatimonadaceae bacterium]|nr:FkbM family methyltransferase [Gemmatimonadaceae bacterium]
MSGGLFGTTSRFLHRFGPLRAVAKRALRGVTLEQRFHGGRISLDAVDHAWAWTGRLRYETFDVELQDALLALARGRTTMLDIGCNVGAMTLSVLLREPNISARSFDANPRAVALLRRSLARNRLSDRASVTWAAVALRDGELRFESNGSVIGHVSESGRPTPAVAFAPLVREAAAAGPCLVKVDVEGFETSLIPELANAGPLANVCLVVELHPSGYNGVGAPRRNLEALRATGAEVSTIDGQPVTTISENDFTNVVARWRA